jgi:hypothetical protein
MRARPRASCVRISVFASLERAFYGRKWILQIPGSPNFSAANLLFCNEQNSTSNRIKIIRREVRQLFACLIQV